MKFVIDRSKWRAGGTGKHAIGKGGTCLLNGAGFMCCLGQVCQQKQLGKCEVLGCYTPQGSFAPHKLENLLVKRRDASVVGWSDNALATNAMTINDDDRENIDQETRERLLKAEFASCGHELEFTGEPVPYHD